MKTSSIFTFLFFLALNSLAQSLWVNNPQEWGNYNGTIEETKITYEPKGLYMNVDWEITFSARGIEKFSEKDTIEVDYRFYLPEGAVVYDSKLWFEDTILTAMIIDRWTASRVYENIVNRRKDPSILYKNGPTYYNLRIFPMAAKESRKVRLSFLMPATWTTKKVSAEFLSRNLLVSHHPVSSINFYANVKAPWSNPVVTGREEIRIERLSTPTEKATHYANIHFKTLEKSQQLTFDAPLNNGVYLGFFEENNNNFYQLALAPTEGMVVQNPRKLLFLLDYEKGNSQLSQTEVLQSLMSNISQLLNERDSFNLVYHGEEIMLASENWVPGNKESISAFFEHLGQEPIVSYDNVADLLKKGISIVNEEPQAKLILLANSDKLSDTSEANDLIDELLELMNEPIPVYIGDYQNNNFYYQWIRNENYRGNEYFYRNLAKLSGGDYVHSFDGDDFRNVVLKIVYLATSENSVVDIHTSLENGFCYGRYKFGDTDFNLLSGVYLETGRYSGTFPFKASISGLYNDEIFSKSVSIPKTEAFESDSLAVKFWQGNEIMEMEKTAYNYSFINDIIEKSLQNRVLCTYTAFLCLEPGMMDELENIDEEQVFNRGWTEDVFVTNTNKTKKSELDMLVYPNPFSERITIEIQLEESIQKDNVTLEIYDIFGKKIKTFSPNEFSENSGIRISWDATDQNGRGVPKGNYVVVCTTPNHRISRKIVLM